jgi:hypothetical protein
MPLRTRNAALLAKIESTPGTFVSPSASTDGVLVENPQANFTTQNVETDEVTGSLDGRGPIIGGMQAKLNFDVYLKGGGTPGVAPEFDELLQACGWGRTDTVTSIGPAVTIAATSGGTITDSGSGLAACTIGTEIFVSGFVAANNNGAFRVTASAAGSLTVTKTDGSAHGLTNESAGPSVTIRRGIAGVTAASGTTTSFTAVAPWAATADLYRGMPVLIGGNPATPAYAFISDYTVGRLATLTDVFGSALSAASIVSIPAHSLYKPISAAIPALSMELYRDGVRYQTAGMRGTVSMEFMAAGAVKASFQMSGIYVGKADAAVPVTTYDGTRPGTFRNSRMLVNRAQAALQTLSLDMGNDLVYPGDPNQTEGFAVPEIVKRRFAGKIDPFETLVATRDIMAAFRAGTEQIIHGRVMGGTGVVAGNRVGLTIPQAFYESYDPGDRSGLATEGVGFFARGQDTGAFLAVW